MRSFAALAAPCLLFAGSLFCQTTPNIGFGIPNPHAQEWGITLNNDWLLTDQILSGQSWLLGLNFKPMAPPAAPTQGVTIYLNSSDNKLHVINLNNVDIPLLTPLGVTSVTAVSPLTGGIITGIGSIGCQSASASQAGCLSAADWIAFNAKQAALTLPLSIANGGNGTATPVLTAGTNVSISGSWPNYTISSSGGVASINWGAITGALSAQTDLQTALNGKQASLGFTPLNAASNLSDLANAATARTNLGLGSAATQASSAFQSAGNYLIDPGANGLAFRSALNTTRAGTASDIVTLFGSGSCSGLLKSDTTCVAQSTFQAALGFTPLNAASNLSDLANAATARANLGLGTAAVLASTTTVGSPGLDTNVPTEKAVRAAITAAGGGNVSAGATLTSGNVVTGAGSTSVQDSGKAAPTGAFVGTTDTQTLTNKSIASTEITGLGALAAVGYPSAGIVKSTGAAFSATAFGDVVSLWTTCTSGFLKFDGSCATPTATPAGSTNAIQYNNAGALGGLTVDTTTTHALFATAGVPAFRALAAGDIPTLNQSTTGNASTATALAAAPSQCGGIQFATGIATNGNANCATPAGGGNVSTSATLVANNVPKATGTTTIADGGLAYPSSAFVGVSDTQTLTNKSISSGQITGLGALAAANYPAAGVVKSSGSAFSATAFGDIVSLWTTCTVGFLKFDGTCSAPSGSGTVNTGTASHFAYYASSTNAVSDSGLALPGSAVVGISDTQTLTNKSITASQLTGTLAAGQFPAMTGDVTNSAGSLATTIGKINSVALSTLTGIIKFSGSSPANAAAADVVALWTSCTAGYLKFDGTCSNPSGAGNVNGPGSSTNGFLPLWNGTSGTALAVGVVAPAGTIVGTTDSQTLTNKSIAASEINSGTLAAAQMAAFTGDVTKPSGSLATTVTALNGTSLAGLATGMVKNTTTTGAPTIAAGGFDFMSPDPINPKDAHAPDGTTVLGCVGDGVTNDTTCLTNLVTYLNAHPLSHVTFPAGKFTMSGTLRLNGAIRLDGAGANATFLVETNATADLLVLVPTTSTPLTGGRGFGPIIQNIGFSGQGSATTGNLLFMQGVGRATLDHVAFYGHGGRALLLANERTYMHDIHWSNVRQGISTSPNWSVNESYLNNYSVSDAGFAFDDVTGTTNSCNYNVNAVSCALPGSGTIVQDQHPFFAFDSNVVDFKISTGSIKPTWIAAIGVRGAQNFEIEHTYFEGYNNGNVNPSIIYGGNHEKTTLTNTISNSVTTFDLVSGAWFPGVVSVAGDIASLSENGQYVRMLIRPPDFIAGSGTASSLGGGITKGMFEYVTFQGIVHDSVGSGWHVHLNARAQNSSTAEAWPAGAVFSETSGDAVNAGLNGIGFTNAAPLKLADNHFNSVSTATGYTISTDANNEKVQGEMVLGFEPDLYYLWGAAQALSSVQRGYTFQGNNQLISSGSAVASIIDTYGYAIIDDAANPNVYSSGFPTNDNHVGLGALGGQYALRETFAAGGGGELDVRDPAFFAIVQGGNTPSVSGYSLPYNGNAIFGNITVTGCSGCGGGGGGAFQANGTPLTSTSTINFENSAAFNGLTATFANPSAGNVQLGFTGTLGNAGLTNSSLTVSAGAGLAGGGSVALGASTSLSRSVTVNAQTGTSYTVLSTDQGKLTTFSNASAVAVTLPQATGAFGAGWFEDFQNKGLGPVTITPTTSTISGGSSWLLNFGNGGRLVSDGTNYQLIDINGGGLSFQAFTCTAGTPCTITHNLNTTVYVYDLIDSSNNSISIKPCTESTSSITCTFTANQSGTAKFVAAGGALSGSGGGSGITALTGDGTASGSGSVALTLATVNSGPGSCGDSTHVCQVTTNGKGLVTAQSAISISGGGGSGWTSGPLSGLPGTCAVGDAYFATDQPANQQLYTCSATNTFTQIGLLGSTGALANTAGALDIVTSVVPRLAAANTFTGNQTIQQGTLGGNEVLGFSTTPTFSILLRSSYIVLTGNVTSFTLASGNDGQEKTLTFCQDATGSRTVAAPSNVHGFFAVGSTLNKCSSQHFTYYTAQTAWLADSAGVTNQ